MKTALLVVDVQNDFCEGGALAVVGGNRVAEDVSAYLSDSSIHYDWIFASVDDHAALPNDNCGHFAAKDVEPDFVKSWPVHCVRGTHGAHFNSNLELGNIDDVVYKGYGCQSYSAFEGVTGDGQTLLAMLRSAEVTHVDVVGLAFDYCVKATAHDANGLGFRTTVIKSLTASVNPDNDFEIVQNMLGSGIPVRGDN